MTKTKKVYFISTYRDIKPDKLGYVDNGGADRVVGYFFSFEEAEEAVLNNWGDLYEDGYYEYAVIEGLEDGLYSVDLHPQFYKWEGDKETGGYKKIERPEFTKRFTGFTIG